jgi:ABC-type amino acid transport substrate-binding protein
MALDHAMGLHDPISTSQDALAGIDALSQGVRAFEHVATTSNSERLKVLLVEDNPGDARLIRELLAEQRGANFDVLQVDRLAPGLALTAGPIDAVLLGSSTLAWGLVVAIARKVRRAAARARSHPADPTRSAHPRPMSENQR